MVEASCRAQCLIFAKVADCNVGVGLGLVLDEVAEDGLLIVSYNEDFFDLGDLGDSLETVFDDGVTRDLE